MVPIVLGAEVMALVRVPQIGPLTSPPTALEAKAVYRAAEELGKVMGLVRSGAEAILLMQLSSVETEGSPAGKGLFPGDVLIKAEEGNIKAAQLRFAEGAFGGAKVTGIELRAPKVLVVLDPEECFKKYRDLVHNQEAIEEVLKALRLDFEVYIPPGGPEGLVPLPEALLKGMDILLDAAEIVGWGWDEGAKKALRAFLDGGGAIVAIEAGCYKYVTKPGKGEAPIPEGGNLELVEVEAIHGGTGCRSESIKPQSPFFLRLLTIELGKVADEFRRTGLKPIGPGAVVLASDAAGVAQVIFRERILLVGPRIVSHVHDRDFSGVSNLDKAYNFYNARLLFNAISLFSGRVVERALSGPKWSFRPQWARMWRLANEKVSRALASLGMEEHKLKEKFQEVEAFSPVGYTLSLLRRNWQVAQEAALHLAAGEPEEALKRADKVIKAVTVEGRRLKWFTADKEEYAELLLHFYAKALTESVERGIEVDKFTRACTLANAAIACAKSGGMQQAVELLKRALKVLGVQRGR